MILKGRFVFINSDTSEYKGKTYFNVTIEGLEEGRIFRIGAEPMVLGNLKKYQTYSGDFRVGVGQKGLYLVLVGVESSES